MKLSIYTKTAIVIIAIRLDVNFSYLLFILVSIHDYKLHEINRLLDNYDVNAIRKKRWFDIKVIVIIM